MDNCIIIIYNQKKQVKSQNPILRLIFEKTEEIS